MSYLSRFLNILKFCLKNKLNFKFLNINFKEYLNQIPDRKFHAKH